MPLVYSPVVVDFFDIFLPHIESPQDFLDTVYHEFGHAIDDLMEIGEETEAKIEEVGIETRKQNPRLYEFIRDLYDLPSLDELFPEHL